MNYRRLIYIGIGILLIGYSFTWAFKNFNFNSNYEFGQKLDSLHGVVVYYNGGVSTVAGRNLTKDNYNLGLKYQCVEFVKRYYYERFQHKMPDSYGNAKDFFDAETGDGMRNKKRELLQYSNPSHSLPQVGDLIIFSGTAFNQYGHVAIISKVTADEIEIIQQNPGPYEKSRETIGLKVHKEKYTIENDRVLGWLRKER
jgi:surface antigen